MPLKPTPERYCENCGKQLHRKRRKGGKIEALFHFTRRKYCDRGCMAEAFDQRHKPDPGWVTAHYHARRAKGPGPCEECGSKRNVDVHHIDGNWRNNALENLQRLCRRCHNREHAPPPRLCSQPGCPNRHRRNGLCDMHSQRAREGRLLTA